MYKSWPEILLLLIISIILLLVATEMLDIHERSVYKSHIWRTSGYLLLISGLRILISFIHIMIIPKEVREKIKSVTREAI